MSYRSSSSFPDIPDMGLSTVSGSDSKSDLSNNTQDPKMDKVYYEYRKTLMTTSRANDDLGIDMEEDSLGMGVVRKEVDLTNDEKQYLLAVERGDIPSTRQYLNMGLQTGLNINCVDPLGRTALLVSIENENIEMIELLLSNNVELGDSLLQAINEENVEAVELLLNHEVATKGEEALQHSAPSSSFTPDITPIILAAHRDNYEIIKLLLDRGYRIPKPHNLRCDCKHCLRESQEDCLRHSRSRINAYRALASPSLIALSSKDPILTAFELSWELRRLSNLENEFKFEYESLGKKCQEFATDLLDQTRGSKELEVVLNQDNTPACNPHTEPMVEPVQEKLKLSRLKLAIKFKQKKFIAHPNCQQLLASLWYDGLPGFRRRNICSRSFLTILIGVSFPFLSLFYLVAPKSFPGKLLRKPFIKFMCHSSSYFTFLVLLILVSQRVGVSNPNRVHPNGQASPVDYDYAKIYQEKRGAPATNIEWMILAYVAGYIWAEIKQLWDEGAYEYVHDMWNILDFVTNSLYIATLTLRVIAYVQVQREIAAGHKELAELERKHWKAYDPNLIAEALFAAANIFSSLKLIYIFTVNPHLGPLQISLGRMILDILKFCGVYILVLFSFACGLNHLYWYYATLRAQECDADPTGQHDSCDRKFKSFANLFEILQTLYWAIFGLVDLSHAELQGKHEFTEFVGKLMFGSYSFLAFIVLLNLLIAMMSSSYINISSQADEEWKFARSKLWMSYFEDTGTLPCPFNIIPSPKTFVYLTGWFKTKLCACSTQQKRNRWQSIRKIVKKINEKEVRYQGVMKDLVKRYIMQKQRGPLRGEGVTEDDVTEIKQDISSFRYELLEILKNNGMKTPNPNQGKTSNRRLSRKRSQMSMERLKRSFKMDTIKEKENGSSGISMEVPTTVITSSDPSSPKSTSPLKTFPDTIFEEKSEPFNKQRSRYDLEREHIHEEERAREHKHISDPNTQRSNNHKSVFRLSTLQKGDEGLGESLDLNSEQSDSSVKASDKFGNDTMSRLQVPSDDNSVDQVEQPSCSFDFYFSDMFSDDPSDGKPSKRVTFL
ncbi:short transient receptor potential channel 4-like isoform X2 [Mytilus trossulus]|uniref:short transient receptor potential channel 4-like isoform X2 n=1 Tax=Mytilus trossulus TaxID=6551 RepID=UPI003006237B